jgi:hypothetical protein
MQVVVTIAGLGVLGRDLPLPVWLGLRPAREGLPLRDLCGRHCCCVQKGPSQGKHHAQHLSPSGSAHMAHYLHF